MVALPEHSAIPAIHVGTSGYSFADWVGVFYPSGTKPGAFLEYYAKHFSCVEVNATYYRIPPAATLAGMAARTPASFRFLVKLHQGFTHQSSFEASLVQSFQNAIAPLKHAGKYHGLLAQFPWAFRRDARTKAHLEQLREAFPGEPLWLEFRHDSWMHPQLADWLRERDLGYCAVDEPQLPHLVPPVTHVTNGIGYVRFHGRNAKNWWGSGERAARGAPEAPNPAKASREQLRYDYDYSEQELMQWVARVSAMAQQAKQTYLFFNNCHAGQAARSAKLMEELLRRQKLLL